MIWQNESNSICLGVKFGLRKPEEMSEAAAVAAGASLAGGDDRARYQRARPSLCESLRAFRRFLVPS
jgi:hypothetical protein